MVHFEILITGDGARLVRDKIVSYSNYEADAAGRNLVILLSNGEKCFFCPDNLTIEDLDYFMTATHHPDWSSIFDVREKH